MEASPSMKAAATAESASASITAGRSAPESASAPITAEASSP